MRELIDYFKAKPYSHKVGGKYGVIISLVFLTICYFIIATLISFFKENAYDMYQILFEEGKAQILFITLIVSSYYFGSKASIKIIDEDKSEKSFGLYYSFFTALSLTITSSIMCIFDDGTRNGNDLLSCLLYMLSISTGSSIISIFVCGLTFGYIIKRKKIQNTH